MGRLPRPEVPPGARRELTDALHALHHEAGWPSLRALAGSAGCSHTTISKAFSDPRLPTWGVLELLVEAMDGDVQRFHQLWLAASRPSACSAPSGADRIAGRRDELVRVRRHLQTGRGLLLVTGEAGIGKTRLVDAASTVDDVFVARGSCLPLSARVPFLAMADALRAVYEVDEGSWWKEALAECAPYVRASLAVLLPELEERTDPSGVADDAWWRQRLFAAAGAGLSHLVAVRPLAVLIEDLHWADPATLDLVEHLVTRGPEAPLLATFRTDDPATAPAVLDWFDRVRRAPGVTSVEVGPLTRDETGDLLELLGGARTPAEVDRIYDRTAGLPLYAEQLASHHPDEEAAPRALVDLLDHRLGDLDEGPWAVARALGIADRPLSDAQLRAVTGMSAEALTLGLRVLGDRRLAAARDHDVRLRHPLLAEAVRRRLVAGEADEEHRRLALALAETPDPSPAEIAEHWRCAGDPARELTWRIRAAEEARGRFALAVEADQWRRALDLWPDAEFAGSPPVRRVDAYLAAFDALRTVDLTAAARLADEGLRSIGDPAGIGAAELLHRSGWVQGVLGDPEAGREVVDNALRIFEKHSPSAGHVDALMAVNWLLLCMDRHAEAAAATARAVEVSAVLGDAKMSRRALSMQAHHEVNMGRLEEALIRVRSAARLGTPNPDPKGDLSVATSYTHILLMSGAEAEEVAAAARPGLDAAEAWGLDTFVVSVLQANVSTALRRAGRVAEAARIIDPVTTDPPSEERWPTHTERAILDFLRGHEQQARDRFDALSASTVSKQPDLLEFEMDARNVDLWHGRTASAHHCLVGSLRRVVGITTDRGADIGGLLAIAARAAADLADSSHASPDVRRDLRRELETLREQETLDPFAPHPVFAVRAANAATWDAERARLVCEATVRLWVRAAAEWDRLGRPHDSAYCRWRAAQVAMGSGQSQTATRLLRRAARETLGHVPLFTAIAETAAQVARART